MSSVCICGNALRRVVFCCIHSFVGITGEVFSDQKVLSKILSKSTRAYITKNNKDISFFFKQNDCRHKDEGNMDVTALLFTMRPVTFICLKIYINYVSFQTQSLSWRIDAIIYFLQEQEDTSYCYIYLTYFAEVIFCHLFPLLPHSCSI